MNETTERLVGVKQVLLPEYEAALAADKTKGYMWFVRNNNITLHNYIYLGSRLYGEAEIDIPFDSVITNIVNGDNAIIVTKTSTEDGTTVELKLNLDPNGGLAITENGLQVDTTKFIQQSELDKVISDVATVNENLVIAIDTINKNVADGFNTINGGIENEIKPAIDEAKNLAIDESVRAQIAETNLQNNLNVETTERRIDVTNLQSNINVETERALAAEKVLNDKIVDVDITELVNKIDTEIVDRTNADIEINKTLETKVAWQKFGETRKTIVLGNDDMLLGTNVAGNSTYNLAMVNKWDVVDLGSTSLPINLNVPSGIRATVQEAGQSGEQANKIAYLTDIVNYSGEITALDEAYKAADVILQNNIDAEKVRAIDAEKVNSDAIVALDEAYKLADVTLQDNIDVNTNSIDVETARAEGVEAKLRTDLDYESTRALGAEANINKALDTKVTWDESGKKITFVEGGMLTGTMSGVTGDAAGVNIAMVNEWNVVDLGSTKLPINLNVPVGIRATVQEAGQTGAEANKIAYLTDIVDYSGEITANTKAIEDEVTRATDAETVLQTNIDTKVSSVELVQDQLNSLHYTLLVDTVVKGEINIPKDQFLKSVSFDETTHTLTFVFDTSDGEKSVEVDLNGLVEVYTAGNGLSLSDGAFSIVIDPLTQSFIEVSANGVKIVGINEAIAVETTRAETAETALDAKIETNTQSISVETARAEGIEAKLRIDVDYEHTRALEAEANINKSLDTKVTWDESKTKIVLPSGGQLVGTKFGDDPLDGATIAQLNQWDVMDFGSSKFPINLNVPAGVRATVQEAGQSGEQANKIAYLTDIVNYNDAITANTNAIADEVTRAKAAEQDNVDAIKGVRTDLTTETTARTADVNKLTIDLGSEVTRATNREDVINAKIDNIIDNGLTLKNGKSIMAEVTNPTGTPVNVLTVTTGNSINVGSNIGQLELESKGDIIAIIDGTNKTVAIKEDIQTSITVNTKAIEDEVTRAKAAETDLSGRVKVIEDKPVVVSNNITNMLRITEAEYNAIVDKDPKTLYIIVG